MYSNAVTYTWAKPAEKRFLFSSHKGPFSLYSEKGEIREPDNRSYVFNEGIINFKDEMETVMLSAHKDSRAVILIQFRETIVAAFSLSKDRGLLIKHLKEKGGVIPIAYKNSAVALLVLPSNEPFEGQIRVKSMQDGQMDQSGVVRICDMANPRIHVPESMLIMYQHLRNEEKIGKRILNKHTFGEHEVSKLHRQKNIGNLSRFFTANEAMVWLEQCKNFTPVERALQTEYVFGSNKSCVISFPKQQQDYVKILCKRYGFIERALFDENEAVPSSDSDSGSTSTETNSQSSGETKHGAMSLNLQQAMHIQGNI